MNRTLNTTINRSKKEKNDERGTKFTVSSNGSFYFPTYDNNGNVTKYVDESGSVVAAYEYDDFGRLTENDGTRYAYNSDGLLASASNEVAVVEYAYTPDRLDSGYTLTLSNGVVFSRSVVRDGCRRSLATGITSSVGGNAVETIAYTYDALSRPTNRNADTFGYNARGEVIFSRRGAENAEESYSYDGIGNLLHSAFNSATNTYTANNLNQYTSILRDSETPREPTHDLDGTMLFDGKLSFSYDAANRLETVSSNGVTLVTNYYDAKSRRVKKVAPEARTTFFYDGWNLVDERVAYTNGTTSTIHYYWGKDLSGSLQGAGGVGGLLYLTIDDVPYVPCYDNNGNITRYLDANGNTIAQYTYDAFGKIAAQAGSLAHIFRYRFSTKYFDAETGLYYYGYRFYHPVLMRWLNRDPIEEDGGLNLYVFCGNNAIDSFDTLGEKILIKENNSIVKDRIATKARAAFFPSASISFSCSWNGVLRINGTASRRIEILTPNLPRWSQRKKRYNERWGNRRDNTTEWRASYAHEMDHWNAFNAFFAFLHLLNEFDGTRLCNKCEEMKDELERQYNMMWTSALQHSSRYDLDSYNYGGAYPRAK